MNFEKVELYGFKSFADKAEIKFGDGITGIVGPNGCGKSNVADAIRWVLGEQSVKSLRGSSMQDVIFSGTQNRKSLSYCEVSLYFDNSSRMFSLDYNEVIITRKLYRSNESEYFINKQPARLKDIIDLLHECGIGKEGYTIIGQGKVEEIMSAKAEDRRLIFEEATGIAKFKARKNESERKLERTHENLVRYSDILSEIENQLGPLEKQAEKAKEFNELSQELKHHELNVYIAKVEGVAQAKEKVNVKIKGLEEEISLRQSEYDKSQREYESIFSDIEKADQKLRELNDKLLEKRINMEKSSGANKLFSEKINFMLNQIERSKGEIEEDLRLIEQSEKAIEVNGEELKNAQAKLKELNAKAEELSKRFLVVSNKISVGEELATASQKKIIESIESLSDFKLNKGARSVELTSLQEKLKEIEDKIEKLSFSREELFNAKEKSDKKIDELDRSVFDFKNKISEKEDEVRASNEEEAQIENKIYNLNSVITSLVTKDNFYRGLKENYEGYSFAVKQLLSKAKTDKNIGSKVKGVVAELIRSDKKYDVALETALGASAQNVVTKDTDDAKYLIQYLKENKMGRLTFLPLTSVKPRVQNQEVSLALKEQGALGVANKIVSYDAEYENVISNLLGNTLIVDTIENATKIANKFRFAFKIVTLDGDVFSTQGAMTGGSRRTDVVGLLSADRKIEDNQEELNKKRAEMVELKKQKEEINGKRDKALDELGMLNDVYNGKRQELVLEREKQATTEKSLSEIGREIEATETVRSELVERINVLSAEMENISVGGQKLEKDRTDATISADKQQQEYDALRKERDSLSEKITEIQVEITEIKASVSAIQSDIERLKETKESAQNSIRDLKKSIEGAEGIIEDLRLQQEKVSFSKEEQDQVNALRDEIDGIEVYKKERRERLEKNSQKKEQLNEEIVNLSEKRHAEEINLTKIDSDLEHMGESIFENYQEDYESAQKYREEGYDAKFGESEISRIRKRRSSLGAINASAIEDCQILKGRYEEMTAQKEDLEKAEKDLKEAIDKIKGEMLTQFDQGFNKINQNFQTIFKELFGGGRAMLQMDYSETDDKLEAGVEIIAEPPGKKLQKLSLLSGGEKALTAIAILFAILKLRPMPFCVLDEVEAALDEANVDRFARYLQKFSEKTQFIVITHKKPTMERANALFGVTMQEKGVSRLVSVKLSDIAEIGDGDIAL
ncbi:MAG: chromosome segregation protein SMC [Clostridia bacterium]|nr:chromosome segregation protein SMC [Clostridia bacterium]